MLGLIHAFNNWLFMLLLVLYLVYIYKNNAKLFKFTIIIMSFFILGLVIKEVRFKNRLSGEKSAQMTVVESKKIETGYQLLVLGKNLKYQINTEQYYEVGDVLIINGKFIDIDSNHVPLLFNYQKYCKYQGIGGKIINAQITKIGKKTVLSSFQNSLCQYYDQFFSPLSAAYLKALVLGDKAALDDDILNNINRLGISHLFVVSGLHVVLLISIIEKIFKKLLKNSRIKTILTMILLIVYTFITNFMISVIRVVSGFVIKEVNKSYQLHLDTLDVVSIVTIMSLICNPYYIFNSSFILSFGLTYALIIGSKILKSKNYLDGLIKMSIYCQIVGIPLSYDFSNQINLLSVVFNMIFVPFVSYIFLPLSLITSFFPFMNDLYELLIQCFEKLVIFTENISLYITLPRVNIEYLILFFVFIYLLFKALENKTFKRGIIYLLIIYISIWLNYGFLNIYDQIIFFDLPNGEATLIHKAFNQYNILIDTGDITDEDNNTILKYLHKRGIKKLDYVIITHSDSDHIGGLEVIMNEVKVKNIITNYYEQRDIFSYYQKYNPNLKIYYLKAKDYFQYYDLFFECIAPSINLGDVNNNSLVFLLSMSNFRILFTGDIESLGEKTIKNDQVIECDLLKIAHHGSKTSTTSEFLEKVKFQTAIIMNGYHNIFDFPSPIVTNRLKPYGYYVTGYEKTIIYQKTFYQKRFKKT